MPVTITLECGGCFAKTEGTAALRREFVSLSGQDHGWGQFRTGTVEDITPDGWVAFDPYTQCTYCPACWAGIEAATATAGQPESAVQAQQGEK